MSTISLKRCIQELSGGKLTPAVVSQVEGGTGTTSLDAIIAATVSPLNAADAALDARVTAIEAMPPIGYNQTWQDVTASRALGTTYTNTTGKPILVSVMIAHNALLTASSLTVGGVICANTYDDGARIQQVTALVPPGATYVAAQTAGSASISRWAELK